MSYLQRRFNLLCSCLMSPDLYQPNLTWLPLASSGYIWPHLATLSLHWLPLAWALLSLTSSCYPWSYLATLDLFWLTLALSGSQWPPLDILSLIRLPLASPCYPWAHLTTLGLCILQYSLGFIMPHLVSGYPYSRLDSSCLTWLPLLFLWFFLP